MFNPLIAAAHQDDRLQATFSGKELTVSTVYHPDLTLHNNIQTNLTR